MPLSYQRLAKIDGQLRSKLDHAEGIQLVKVPVSDAAWNTWRRYCDLAGLPMGRGLAMLLQQELATVVNDDLEGVAALVTAREVDVSRREVAASEREAALYRREQNLEMRERRIATRTAAPVSARPPTTKPGRNEPCWCGSGKNFKVCHGRPG